MKIWAAAAERRPAEAEAKAADGVPKAHRPTLELKAAVAVVSPRAAAVVDVAADAAAAVVVAAPKHLRRAAELPRSNSSFAGNRPWWCNKRW